MMQFTLTFIGAPTYIDLPVGLVGWLGWFTLLGSVLIVLGYNLAHTPLIPQGTKPLQWVTLFLFLLLLVPVASLFIAVRLPAGDSLPPPGRPVEPTGPVFVLLIGLPFALSAGFLGAFPTFLISLFSGIFLAFWDTHNPFTPLEFCLVALLFTLAVRQRYSSREFQLLRIPIVAALVLSLAYPALFFFSSICYAGGDLANRLDYAFTHLLWNSLAMAVQLLVAGLLATLFAVAMPDHWGSQDAPYPSPMERSLALRLLYTMSPLALMLLLTLLVSNWIVAGNAARQMLKNRMENAAGLSAETIPFFLESGHSLIQKLAEDPEWLNGAEEDNLVRLQQARLSVPFFNQMFLLNTRGEVVVAFPPQDRPRFSENELNGIELALLGVPVQNYALPPVELAQQPKVSFIASIPDPELQQVKGILIGHTDITLNPFTRPILFNLNSMKEFGGDGILLDSDSRILYHTSDLSVGEVYPLPTDLETSSQTFEFQPIPQFYEDRAPDGTRRLVYYQPAVGQPWSIILAIPARQSQQLALQIATPMLLMIVVASAAIVIILLLGMRFITQSLEKLAREANRIASGQLDHPLVSVSEDEVGRLSRAFEQMRLRLQTRMEELNRLLTVSQGVASSLDLPEAATPALEAALAIGAASARIVLTQAALPESEASTPYPTRFGVGPKNEAFQKLDEQVLSLVRQQDQLILGNLNRVRLIQFPPDAARPEALLAMSLRHENAHYGVLWLAFEKPHNFSDDEIRFISTLASQTALAITNARLFLNAEVGRQRLAGILASTPDPVLVTDHQNRLLLSNPVAWQVLHLSGENSQGQPIDRLIFHPELVELLRSSAGDRQSAEITVAGSRVFLATASPVMVGERKVGRVCVLRDITHLKELDALKSEFVATVSHDLRSPLTLMRGYATMMEMVGDLNEQQAGYVKKIIQGIEAMTRLVNNLLDLGRIEAGVDLQLEVIAVEDIVERVTNSQQLQASQKQIQLTTEYNQPGMPPIQADAALLTQALQNLIENAIKYTDNGGAVHIKVSLQAESILFEISDTGIGIAPVDQPRLFEKFYRGAQRNARKRQGSGLGLAIVKSIAERHGGSVWVNSQLGQGSTFGLAIPLRHPVTEAT
jgi:signal transduction histidine kinase/HAMP domain-containing protein